MELIYRVLIDQIANFHLILQILKDTYIYIFPQTIYYFRIP